jgi:hypothetical protein
MLSETQIDPTIHEMYMDTNQLRKMFPFDYREAEYFIDQQTGCWKRKIQVTDIMLKASHSSSSSSSTSCSTDVEKEITLPVQKLQDEDDQIVTFEIDEETQQRFLVRTF